MPSQKSAVTFHFIQLTSYCIHQMSTYLPPLSAKLDQVCGLSALSLAPFKSLLMQFQHDCRAWGPFPSPYLCTNSELSQFQACRPAMEVINNHQKLKRFFHGKKEIKDNK